MSSWGGNLTQYWIYSGGGILRALSHSFNLISKGIRFHRSQIIKDILYILCNILQSRVFLWQWSLLGLNLSPNKGSLSCFVAGKNEHLDWSVALASGNVQKRFWNGLKRCQKKSGWLMFALVVASFLRGGGGKKGADQIWRREKDKQL